MVRTFRNARSNEVVTTDMSNDALLSAFAATADDHNWLWFWITKQVQETQKAPQMRDALSFLADSFRFAIGMGLKSPMIRLHYTPEGMKSARYKIYLSARGTVCIKIGLVHQDTKDPVGNEEYMGCIYSGRFRCNYRRRLTPENEAFLERLTTDPVGFLAKCSKDMDRCCYCNRPLEDIRSKDVGYGETCAERWGLPWGRSYDEKIPSFAQLWAASDLDTQNAIRGICKEIRESEPGFRPAVPRRFLRGICEGIRETGDPFLWDLLGDILKDVGYTKTPKPPEYGVIIPTGR